MAEASRTLEIIIRAKDEATKTLQGFSGELKSLQQNVKTSATFFAGIGAASLIAAKGFVQAAGEMEQTRASFNTLIGDSKLAKKTLEDLFTLEAKTPLNLQEIMQGSKQLLAMGTNAKDLVPTFTMLGNVAAGVGKEKLPQLILAFGQIQSRGRLMGTELRQLTEAGFNLADAMGVTSMKLDEMIASGEVSFEDVKNAFAAATGEGGRFHGLMDQLAQTTPGRISTMESSIYRLQAAFGEALLPAVNRLIDALLPAIESVAKFAAEHQTLTAFVLGAGLVLGALGVAVLLLGPIIAGITATIALLTSGFGFLAGAITLIVGILGGPVTLVILAVIAIVGALYMAWTQNWFGIQQITASVVGWLETYVWPTIVAGFNLIKAILTMLFNYWLTSFKLKMEAAKMLVDFIMKNVVPGIQSGFTTLMNIVKTLQSIWTAAFNAIKSVIDSVTGAINAMINAAKSAANAIKGGLKIPGFQHGGFVPGAFNDAVPAVLHGGERIIPRNGTDVNPGMGGGSGGGVTINISGSFNLDSESRVEELAEKIIRVLGRQNELSSKGLAI